MGALNLSRAALAVPAVVLAAAAVLADRAATLPLPAALAVLPYAVAVLGALLGWWFNRGRVAFSLGVVAAGYWVAAGFAVPPGPMGQVAYAAAALLVPLNLALFAFLEERGVATRPGLWRLALLAAQAAGVAFLVADGALGDAAAAALHARLLPTSVDAWTTLPQPALLGSAIGLAVMGVRILGTGAPLDGGTAGAMVAAGLGFDAVGRGAESGVYFTAATLVLLAALVQDAYRMAFHDELTGLPGRRALGVAMKKLGGRYAIAMLDVDHFKKFNDTHGHHVGDQVLQMVAARVGRVAGGGRAFRYGGEEFAVLFPGKDIDNAWDPLERLCWAVADSQFRLRRNERPRKKPSRTAKQRPRAPARRVGVTISIGVAERQPGEQPEDVLKAADEALYRAKKGGRNRLTD